MQTTVVTCGLRKPDEQDSTPPQPLNCIGSDGSTLTRGTPSGTLLLPFSILIPGGDTLARAMAGAGSRIRETRVFGCGCFCEKLRTALR